MFVWTSGFQKSLAHTDFNMFVDERTSANESPVFKLCSDRAKANVKVKIFFEVCRLFVDIFCLFFDVFRFM